MSLNIQVFKNCIGSFKASLMLYITKIFSYSYVYNIQMGLTLCIGGRASNLSNIWYVLVTVEQVNEVDFL